MKKHLSFVVRHLLLINETILYAQKRQKSKEHFISFKTKSIWRKSGRYQVGEDEQGRMHFISWTACCPVLHQNYSKSRIVDVQRVESLVTPGFSIIFSKNFGRTVTKISVVLDSKQQNQSWIKSFSKVGGLCHGRRRIFEHDIWNSWASCVAAGETFKLSIYIQGKFQYSRKQLHVTHRPLLAASAFS